MGRCCRYQFDRVSAITSCVTLAQMMLLQGAISHRRSGSLAGIRVFTESCARLAGKDYFRLCNSFYKRLSGSNSPHFLIREIFHVNLRWQFVL